MTATNHGLAGAVIAITLQRYPVAALALSPLSHFLLDAFPHFGDDRMSLKSRKFIRILSADATLAVVTTLTVAWFWPQIALLVVACAFLAASPDLMWIYYEYMNKPLKNKHPLPRFHSWIQWSQTPSGVFVEAVWFLALLPALLIIGYHT